MTPQNTFASIKELAKNWRFTFGISEFAKFFGKKVVLQIHMNGKMRSIVTNKFGVFTQSAPTKFLLEKKINKY